MAGLNLADRGDDVAVFDAPLRVVSKSEAAKRYGVSKARISQLTAPGKKLFEAVTEDGLVDLEIADALLEIRLDVDRPHKAANVGAIDRALKEEKLRAVRAGADKAEMERAVMLGNLADAAAVERYVAAGVRRLRDRLLETPAQLSDRLAACSDPREVEALLRRALNHAFADFVATLDAEPSIAA